MNVLFLGNVCPISKSFEVESLFQSLLNIRETAATNCEMWMYEAVLLPKNNRMGQFFMQAVMTYSHVLRICILL